MIHKIFHTTKEKIKHKFYSLLSDSRGMGTIEMVLLILVILGILVLFRDYIHTGGSSGEYWAMGETLTQQRRVKEEGLRVVNFFYQGRRT